MIIQCIEVMVESWLIRCLLEIAAVFILVTCVTLAVLLFLEVGEVKERSRKNEMSAMRIKQKIESNRHKDDP